MPDEHLIDDDLAEGWVEVGLLRFDELLAAHAAFDEYLAAQPEPSGSLRTNED